ncbi:uncharacterized protein LOC121992135 [Zingiber officinale]|uniref:uncharacterized protein LOC121992135 n=1 Tax=Zingiber officinale TaxID=94328 RepID=UPI001C4D515B|nr:uncharacterized protein LOC121992135 [Zingiber officinale]
MIGMDDVRERGPAADVVATSQGVVVLSRSPNENPGDGNPPAAALADILKALEVVERDSVAITESFTSLFSSLRLVLAEASSTSLENMQCFNDVVGRLQESALDAATKGNHYINSYLRLHEEMRNLETLALQLQVLRKNVDSLDQIYKDELRDPRRLKDKDKVVNCYYIQVI